MTKFASITAYTLYLLHGTLCTRVILVLPCLFYKTHATITRTGKRQYYFCHHNRSQIPRSSKIYNVNINLLRRYQSVVPAAYCFT